MVWMFVSPYPQTSDVEILTPKVVILVGGVFGRCLKHEGGALMNGISAFRKETPERFLAPPTVCNSEKVLVYQAERGPSPKRDVLRSLYHGLPSPQNYEQSVLLFIISQVCGILLCSNLNGLRQSCWLFDAVLKIIHLNRLIILLCNPDIYIFLFI